MTERGDWSADPEGNLTPPDEEPRRPRQSDTDEFGREDPASIERERRRREREARRGGRSAPREKRAKRGGDGGRGLLGGLRRRRSEAEAPPEIPQADDLPPPGGGQRPPGAGRRPPEAGQRPPAGYRRRRVLAAVGVLAGVLVAWFLVALFQPFAGEGLGGERIVVKIPKQASAGEIADLLADEGVVSNGTLLELRLKLSGKADKLASGLLPMASGMSYSAAIDRLTGESQEKGRLVLPEGFSREQNVQTIADAGVTGDYLAASTSSKGFDPAKYGAPKEPASLEGFLFPATYSLYGGETAKDLVNEQLRYFKLNLKQVDLSYAKKKNLTPYDVLIIASMIDREVVKPKERPLVAAVIYNRLSRGEPLGIDATTRYEYNSWTKAITQAQLDKATPYNTRLNVGLPPTPIGNPGLAAIEAAANPAKVDYLFYVVDPNSCNGHSFTANEAEFNKLVAEYNKAREAAGGQAPSTC
jgi:uncharacterized YceG family protein